MAYKPVKLTERSVQKAFPDNKSYSEYLAELTQLFLAMEVKKLRSKSDLTQEELALLSGTKKPAISRLESESDLKHCPSIPTLTKLAVAMGYKLEINFVLDKARRAYLKKHPQTRKSTAANEPELPAKKKAIKKSSLRTPAKRVAKGR